MKFGVIKEGFLIKDVDKVISEIEDDERSEISASLNTNPDSVAGQLNGIFGDKVAGLWELGLSIYRSFHPDHNTGDAQDNVAAISGAKRLGAKSSEVTLSLNLDPLAIVPIGAIVGIGPTGERWETTSGAINVSGVLSATVDVSAKSVEKKEVSGNAGSIDTIVTASGGWSAKSALQGLAVAPFQLLDSQTLIVSIDGTTETVTFSPVDFVDIAAATALELKSVIEAQTSGLTVIASGNILRFESNTDGPGSSIHVVGGTAIATLGLSREKQSGMNVSRSAKISSGNSETFDMSGSPSLFVKVDGNVLQSINFIDADFGVKSSGFITAIEASLLDGIGDGDTFSIKDNVNPVVTFVFDNDGTVVEASSIRAVNHTGTETVQAMRVIIVDAINAAPLLDVVASVSTKNSSDVFIQNSDVGVAGNGAIVESVVDAGFVVSGLSGGVDATPLIATSAQVATSINRQISNGHAYEDSSGQVVIESLTTGNNSLIEISGGSANGALGFSTSDEKGGTSGDAILGMSVESNESFRARREALVQLPGSGPLGAMRAAVLKLDGVSQAFVFENVSNSVDAFGRPPKSFEVVVLGGDSIEIANAIFLKKPLGIQPFAVPGANGVTVPVTGSQGNTYQIGFSRVDEIDMYVAIEVKVDSTVFGGGLSSLGAQLVRDAIEAQGESLAIGEDITMVKFRCAPLEVVGVEDIISITIDSMPVPVNTANIAIAGRELAKFASARISVIATPI